MKYASCVATRSVGQTLVTLWKSEDGWVTPLMLCLTVVFFGLGGLAVDVSNAVAQRTMLQVTADASAHAALLMRRTESEASAKQRAVTLGGVNMPSSKFGTVISTSDVVFGTWNTQTHTFTAAPGSSDAVRVTARRQEANSNPVRTYFLKLIGFNYWNVSAPSVYYARNNPCYSNGALANNIATFQSNGIFYPGFCIHGNNYVSLKQNNTFKPGTVVSMPDLAKLNIPASGMTSNVGLADALRTGRIDLGVVRSLPTVINNLQTGLASAMPKYVTNLVATSVNQTSVTDATFKSGNVYNVRCNGNNTNLTLTSGMTLKEVVITTNCPIQMGNGAKIEDSIIATTNTSSTSISGTSGSGAQSSVGRACAPGPGTQVLTLGGMHFPSKLNVNGGQFVATGTIGFAAQAEIAGSGVSVISGQNVDWTSNASMSVAYCDAEFLNHLADKRVRLID